MGGRVAGRPARQHSDLTEPCGADSAFRFVVLTFLALDGFLCAILAVFFMPLYWGVVPFPISAVLAGAANMGLVWAASQWTSSFRVAALPLLTWVLTVLVMMLGGPGGDIIFPGRGIMAGYPLILLLVGAGPAGWYLMRRNAAVPVRSSVR